MVWRVLEGVCEGCGKKIVGFQLCETMDSPVTGVSWNHADGSKYRHIIIPNDDRIVSKGEVS